MARAAIAERIEARPARVDYLPPAASAQPPLVFDPRHRLIRPGEPFLSLVLRFAFALVFVVAALLLVGGLLVALLPMSEQFGWQVPVIAMLGGAGVLLFAAWAILFR